MRQQSTWKLKTTDQQLVSRISYSRNHVQKKLITGTYYVIWCIIKIQRNFVRTLKCSQKNYEPPQCITCQVLKCELYIINSTDKRCIKPPYYAHVGHTQLSLLWTQPTNYFLYNKIIKYAYIHYFNITLLLVQENYSHHLKVWKGKKKDIWSIV